MPNESDVVSSAMDMGGNLVIEPDGKIVVINKDGVYEGEISDLNMIQPPRCQSSIYER